MEQNIRIENQHTEFKRILNDRFEISVVAFLNSKDGGVIYIGMDDDGSVFGVENPDILQKQVADRIKNNIRGECLGLYDIILEKREGKNVVKLVISSGTEKPYYIREKGMTSEGCFIRNGSRIESMTSAMIEKMFARRTRNTLSVLLSPKQDLGFEQLKIFYEEHGKKLNDQFAKNLDFLTPDGKYNLNAFLFADQNNITVKVAKFAGPDKRELVENEEYGFCSIIKSCKRVLEKLEIENKTFAKVGYPFRKEKKMIDPDSLREAVINAFVHNDYTDLMSPAFYIFSDHIEIVSYGGLIDGMTKEEFLSGISRPRNREIMRIFRDVDLVEQLGTGMEKILSTYNSNIFKISPNFLRVHFDFDSLGSESEDKVQNNETDFPKTSQKLPKEVPFIAIRTFELIKQNPSATVAQLAVEEGVSDRTIKAHIALLKKEGLIERTGGKTKGMWIVIPNKNL